MNDKKTPPLKLCVSGSREAYYQQIAIERQMSTPDRLKAMQAKLRG